MKEKNLKLLAYNHIKEKIISGELKQNEKIEESLIAQELNISRTPVREAINILKEEDWITIISRKGIFVKNITLKDINDIFQIREMVEPLILKLAFQNMEEKEINEYIEFFEKYKNKKENDTVKLDYYDNELHYYILRCSNNKYFITLMNNVYEHNQRLRNISDQVTSRRDEATEEHLEILYAIKDKNVDLAIDKLNIHIKNSKINFLMSISNLNI